MANNVFLFTGEEKFLLYETIATWKNAFIQKYGSNVYKFDLLDSDVSEIVNTVFSGGLFNEKKLVFIFGFPKDSDSTNKIQDKKIKEIEDQLFPYLTSIPEEVVLAFVSFLPDKRTKAYKNILNVATEKKYNKLNSKQIIKFVEDRLGEYFEKDCISYFLDLTGNDLFTISKELEKIKHYCNYYGIKADRNVLENVVYPRYMVNSFDVLDKMFFDVHGTLSLIKQVEKSGTDPFQFVGMLFWGLKANLQVMDCYKSGEKDNKALASKLGLHPFVVSKNLKIADKLVSKEKNIKYFYKSLINLEYNIKNGFLPQELIWPEIKRICSRV